RRRLAAAIGLTWTNELLTVTGTDPAGPVAPHPSTVLGWRDGPRTGDPPPAPPSGSPGTAPPGTAPLVTARPTRQTATSATTSATEGGRPPPDTPAVVDLIGAQDAARRLAEWCELAFHRPELLRKLGADTRLGVAVHGPEGVGKSTMVRAVARDGGVQVIELA